MAKSERLSRALASGPADLSFSFLELQFSFLLAPPCARKSMHFLIPLYFASQMNGVSMSESRRSFFRNATVLGAGLMSWAGSVRAQKSPSTAPPSGAQQKDLPHPHSKSARMKSS